MKNLLIFLGGAVIGSAITYTVVKKHFMSIADDEISNMREYFSKNNAEENDQIFIKSLDLTSKKTEVVEECGYIPNEPDLIKLDTYTEETIDFYPKDGFSGPRAISPSDYLSINGYDKISLIYYMEDKVLLDDQNRPVDDIDGSVGILFGNHFDEYDDNSVYIRNDRISTDFEIVKNPGKSEDVIY